MALCTRPRISFTERRGEFSSSEAVCVLSAPSCAVCTHLSVAQTPLASSVFRIPQRDPQLRSHRHRQDHRSLCGLLSVRLRQLDEEQSHSGRQIELGTLLRTARAQHLHPARHSGAGAGARKHTPIQKKVGDYYAACMDEIGDREKGNCPFNVDDERHHRDQDASQQLIAEVGAMHRDGIRRCSPSARCPTCTTPRQTIANLDQGGLTLPDRDYYFKDDPKSVETRQKYLEHVQKMFELAGDKPDVAAAEAKTVLAVETGLAKAAMDRTARRDPKNRDHMMEVQAETLAPNFQLDRVFCGQQSAEVRQPQRRQSGLLQGRKRAAQHSATRRLEDLPALARARHICANSCPRHSSTRISSSTASTCRVRRRLSRAGSAASSQPIRTLAWRWGSSTSTKHSVRKARSAR